MSVVADLRALGRIEVPTSVRERTWARVSRECPPPKNPGCALPPPGWRPSFPSAPRRVRPARGAYPKETHMSGFWLGLVLGVFAAHVATVVWALCRAAAIGDEIHHIREAGL